MGNTTEAPTRARHVHGQVSVWLLLATVMLLVTSGCDQAKEGAEKAEEAGKETVEKGKEAAEKAGESGKETVGEAVEAADDAVNKVTSLVGEQTETTAGALAGTLSDTAQGMLQSVQKDDTIADLVLKGEQTAPLAAEMARAVDDAYDSETTLEPIYQSLEEDETGAADEAIGEMPRTEVIDGITVGFRDMTLTETDKRRKERGVLIMWRRNDHLVGFVYRSESQINIDNIVKDAPRLLELTQDALAE